MYLVRVGRCACNRGLTPAAMTVTSYRLRQSILALILNWLGLTLRFLNGALCLTKQRCRYSGGTAPSIVQNFTFATVKGSGHMVPQFQPKRGFELFKSFITNGPPLY